MIAGQMNYSQSVISITASDGHVLDTYLIEPDTKPVAGLIVCQDAFGVGDYIKDVCVHYARLGYKVAAPSLYDRQQKGAILDHSPAGLESARALRKGLLWDQVVLDVAAAMTAVSDAGRTGILGFCVGGSMAWYCASRLRIDAASCYYGKDIVGWLDRPPACPTELHFGTFDHLIPQTDVDVIRAAQLQVALYTYEAGHGFDGRGRGHDDVAANAARDRTKAFFEMHLRQ